MAMTGAQGDEEGSMMHSQVGMQVRGELDKWDDNQQTSRPPSKKSKGSKVEDGQQE